MHFTHPRDDLITALRRIGIQPTLCLDVGALNSWPGSGQKWLDQSGAGYDFFRGLNGTVEPDNDPAFTGTAGRQSDGEYWALDAGDVVLYDTTAESWMQSMHKPTAVWTVGGWLYCPTTLGSIKLLFSNSISTNPSVDVRVTSSGGEDYMALLIGNNSGGSVVSASYLSAGALTKSAWNYVAISYRAGSPNHDVRVTVNGASTDYNTANFNNPTSLDNGSANPGALAVNASAPAGYRYRGVHVVNGLYLSTEQQREIFRRTRSKYGV